MMYFEEMSTLLSSVPAFGTFRFLTSAVPLVGLWQLFIFVRSGQKMKKKEML